MSKVQTPLLLHAVLGDSTSGIVMIALFIWALGAGFALIGLRLRRKHGVPALFLSTIIGSMLATMLLTTLADADVGAMVAAMGVAGLAQASVIALRTRGEGGARTMREAAIGGLAFAVVFAVTVAGAVKIGALR